jgi:hypothetical protein
MAGVHPPERGFRGGSGFILSQIIFSGTIFSEIIQNRDIDTNDSDGRQRQPFSPFSGNQQECCPRIAENIGHSLLGVLMRKKQAAGPGLEDRQMGDYPLNGRPAPQTRHRLRHDARGPEPATQHVRQAVKFGITDDSLTRVHGCRARVQSRPRFKRLMQTQPAFT